MSKLRDCAEDFLVSFEPQDNADYIVFGFLILASPVLLPLWLIGWYGLRLLKTFARGDKK